MSYPLLVVDVERAQNNMSRMAEKATRCKLEFRPHFKTHQSHHIGAWFRALGVSGITVSSVDMAEYFAQDGWKDITVAFPVSILDIARINKLTRRVQLRVLVLDEDTVKKLDEGLQRNLEVYIELDPDYGRSGIKMNDIEAIERLVFSIEQSSHLQFEGFYVHVGQTYACRSREEIEITVRPILNQLRLLKNTFNVPICYGDTPSCSILEEFGPIDQISPGNFVFYDWMQVQIGSCTEQDVAVTMQCPIVAKFPKRNQLLIHGGAVHFSKEMLKHSSGRQCYGVVVSEIQGVEGTSYLSSVSQEHGILTCSPEFFHSIKIGDIVPIYPIHSCLTANLMRSYVTNYGAHLDHLGSKLLPSN